MSSWSRITMWFMLIHILSAIVAVGANVGYAFWLWFAERDRGHLDFAVGGIQRMDRVLTGPSYGVLLLSGVLLILAEGWLLSEFWLLAGIVLYLISGIVSFFVLIPALRSQLALAGESGSVDYRAAARRSRFAAWRVIAIVTAVAWLMVIKPVL